MRKKLIALFIVLISASSFLLVGCSGYSKIKVSAAYKQNTDYVVYSNGGNAVQYGNLIYFINGTRGYEDTDGKSNAWGKVVKGGLYKARLYEGATAGKSGRQFNLATNASTGLEFFSSVRDEYGFFDEDEEIPQIDFIDAERIVPKTIGTSGYNKGGIFIYDDYIYYATPNNSKNKSGVVQSNKTDFMRTKVDGSDTQLIFTTEEDSASSAYGFYKYGSSVYLVSHYGTKLVSVRMKDGSKKIEKANLITDKAVSVLMAHRETYDSKNNITNDPEDFIFFTRELKESDLERAGNVVEAVRPDGSENFNVLMTGEAITLEAINGGGLFYRTTDAVSGNAVIKFDNLHEKLMRFSKTYKAFEDSKSEDGTDSSTRKRLQVNETVFNGSNLSSYTSTYCYRTNLFTNQCYILGFTDSAVHLLTNYGGIKRILNGGATMQFINGADMYFIDPGDNILYKTNFTLSDAEKGEDAKIQVSDAAVVSSGLKADFVAGYAFFFGNIDEWADGYANLKDTKREGAEQIKIYIRDSADEKPDEEPEENTEG